MALYLTRVVYTYLDPLNKRVERKLAHDKKKQAVTPGGIAAEPLG